MHTHTHTHTHTLLTPTQLTLVYSTPHTHYLPHTDPPSKYTPDQYWQKTNKTGLIHAIKTASRGSKKELPTKNGLSLFIWENYKHSTETGHRFNQV